MNKRGLEMAVTTVIMIILSIAVLTILIVYVNSQTGFLSRWLGNYESKSNVDEVVGVCNNLVATEAYYSYCCEKRDIILGGKGKVDENGDVVENELSETCDVARGEGWSAGRINDIGCDGISC
jgi:hypothetical protein